jgi:alanine racemase
MPRPLVATIHLNALQHNLAVAVRHAPGARIWAVVKANGYGHGLLRAMRGFAAADGLALIEFDNAEALRAAGWTKPLLMLEGCFDMADWRLADRLGLNITVHCPEQLLQLESGLADGTLHGPFDLHLKLNSGMNRLGFTAPAFRAAFQRLRALPAVRNVTLMTHFANADAPLKPALPLARQIATFDAACAGLAADHSLANSAATLARVRVEAPAPTRAQPGGEWVRPGIMLYGGAASAAMPAEFGLQPAMTLASEIIGVQHIDAGDAVGYGSRFVACTPMRIGIVACGYADGYPRHACDGTPVQVDGVRTQLVGRVSMDMLMVDLAPIPAANIGTPVELWGAQLPIDLVAASADTLGYELMCALAARVRIKEDQHG